MSATKAPTGLDILKIFHLRTSIVLTQYTAPDLLFPRSPKIIGLRPCTQYGHSHLGHTFFLHTNQIDWAQTQSFNYKFFQKKVQHCLSRIYILRISISWPLPPTTSKLPPPTKQLVSQFRRPPIHFHPRSHDRVDHKNGR